MAIKYPSGKVYLSDALPVPNKKAQLADTYSNRGMTLEEDLNSTNEYYLARGIAVIHKKPTPVQIVQVDYPKRSAAVIKEAYFKQASTTDYNGVYKGKYLDFEAKETQSLTSFPLKNFHEHQITHMKKVQKQQGISFVIIRFSAVNELYLLPCPTLFQFWERMENGGRKSITKDELAASAVLIPEGFHPRIPYLDAIDKLYFSPPSPDG